MKSPKENEGEGGQEGGDIELAVGDGEHKGAGDGWEMGAHTGVGRRAECLMGAHDPRHAW